MAIVDAINKVTGGHGSTIEEAVKGLSAGGGGGASGIEIVKLYETSTGVSGSDSTVSAAPLNYLAPGYNSLKDIVGNRVILDIIVEVSDNNFITYGPSQNGKLIVPHQFEEGFLESFNFPAVTLRRSSSQSYSVSLTYTVYAVLLK